ncbi:MAG: hypothetical protein HOI47_07430 [Candidatus Scalindua sp.]|jgi:uncharacterized protein (TIGR02145 family)|nr:hypothetical protein [Candidatus Scalindua sp.]
MRMYVKLFSFTVVIMLVVSVTVSVTYAARPAGVGGGNLAAQVGENTTAIGDNKTAIGDNKTAIGNNTTAINTNTTAIGALEAIPWTTDGFGSVSTTGSVKVGNDTSDCTSQNAGSIRFNGTNFEGCNGTEWVALDCCSSSFVCGTDQVQDADGNSYNTVQIGSQCWMAENLNVGTNNTGYLTDNDVIEKHCYGDHALGDVNCATEGGLYPWDEAMQYSTEKGAQGICPTGWHIPTDSEWKTLEMELGMTQEDADLFTDTGVYRGVDEEVGTQLKEGGTSGFEAIMAGYRDGGTWGYYQGRLTAGLPYYTTGFWTSTLKLDIGAPIFHGLNDFQSASGRQTSNRGQLGFSNSVRCLKD